MTTKRLLKELIVEIRENLALRYGHERVLELMSKENCRLREENKRLVLQNNKLMDRLMARDFESYANYKEDEENGMVFSTGSKNEPLLDDSFIGEVITE